MCNIMLVFLFHSRVLLLVFFSYSESSNEHLTFAEVDHTDTSVNEIPLADMVQHGHPKANIDLSMKT